MKSSETNSAILNFADELRQAREFRRVSLAEVAASTRIQAEFLAAIELGKWEDVPDAYLRGYIASYAAAVGMNREKVLVNFDKLRASDEGHPVVRVDSAGPLLKGPQHVELTRSKIRAEWFAALYRRRFLAYLLSVGLVVGTYYFVRNAGESKLQKAVKTVSFEQALDEANRRPTAPFRQAGHHDSSTTKPSDILELVANRKCTIVLVSANSDYRTEDLTEFDTLRVDKRQFTEARVSPAGVVQVFTFEKRILGSTDARGDTTIYAFAGRESAMIALDSLSADSL